MMGKLLEVVRSISKVDDFSLELSKAVEEASIEMGLPFKQVIKEAHELLEKQVIK